MITAINDRPSRGRGRRDRVARALRVAGLEAGGPLVGVTRAGQELVVVRERAVQAGRIVELERAQARVLRDLRHRHRVAGRDRDVVRAHPRAALVRRLVVEAGRVGEGAVLHAEPLPALLHRGDEAVEAAARGFRDRVGGVVGGGHEQRRHRVLERPLLTRGHVDAARGLAGGERAHVDGRVRGEPLDGGQRGHHLRGARRRQRIVLVIGEEHRAGLGVDDDVRLGRGRLRRRDARRDARRRAFAGAPRRQPLAREGRRRAALRARHTRPAVHGGSSSESG